MRPGRIWLCIFRMARTRTLRIASIQKGLIMFCWWCGKDLKLPYYAIVINQIGQEQKVHKVCAEDAKNSIRAITAKSKDE